MSQQPTPTSNPCLHASFQKENRTLAMGPVRRRSVPKYPCAAVLRPIWPPSPRRPNPVEPAIRLHSCVEQLAAHTTVHSAPRQAAVNHHFACLEHHCTIIVSTSKTTPSYFYRTRTSGYLGTVQQVKRDIYREVGGRAPDCRVHFTSCRPAGLHRATRHTKASQRPVTPVRSSQRCAAARCTRVRLVVRFDD